MQTITVSKTSPASFRTLQEAVLSIDDGHKERIRIHVEPGIYEEKVFIRKENIEIIGDDPETTEICYGDGAYRLRPDGSMTYGTFNTAVILFAGRDITMENITVRNTAGPGETAGQALAIYAGADRSVFRNCRFLGYQDTIFAGYVEDFPLNHPAMHPDFFVNSEVPIGYTPIRNYFKDCYICGDVDFIFGPNAAFFEDCEIHTERHSFITAASTPIGQEYGLVFYHCNLTGREDAEECYTYLGRPWRDFAKTAFICCTMGKQIYPEGWNNWDKPKAEAVCSYVEYGNEGPGASAQNSGARAAFSKQLDNPGIPDYFSKKNVLGGDDGWNPQGEI
ncbi:MAG: pectinesterase family protein [Lachnospiraceae bacterium]|nr:pectinesterase family protein [Lachnospiraceae bacterium]